MNVKISKWGNSYGIRLPKKMLVEMGFAEHTEFDIFTKGQTFLLKPRQPHKKAKYTLDELLAQYDPSKHHHEEIDWGPPVGKEIW